MVSHSLESAHAAVVGLVEDFAASEAHYLSPGYSEAQVRVSFIDKFWMALGWDVHHEHQKNPYAQEVKVEDPQKIEGSSRRADYAFFTAPDFQHPRFFCEAKKPSVQLKTDADAAFQTIRYGKSADTPLAVLTDFEQLHILDCRVKPDIDTALARSHRFFHYRDWLKADTFAEFYYLFSREAFSSGGFDAYVAALPKPRKVGTQFGLLRAGSQPVGNDFLLDLETYRQTLAELLHAAAPSLDGDSLTELVQRILDRLIFLRFLEDKLIETEIQVQDFSRAAGGHSWQKFLAASRKLDTRYNGIVFKHHPLLDGPGRLPVDEGRFADLCEQLAYTRSPYNLHYIPVHILGSIYERFLGKVITDQGGIEEKPEVRKAGGVYYTPEYIVRYICEQTVGRLVEGKSPAQIARLRFADIACGSGSFLLGVYDLLLRTHGLWYNANSAEAVKENLAPPDKSKKRRKEFIPAVVEFEGVLRLTLEKKREILLNSVFGVDLDPQAVEVAQFSLYLKLLEDETTASARQHYLDFAEALLPSLGKNVVRGNSLIGTDILFGQFEFSAREERKLAPMDFESAFPAVMKDGGFDAVVGNPPYGAKLRTNLDAYIASRFPRSATWADTYCLFVEQSISVLKPGAMLAYIVPNTFCDLEGCSVFRKWLLTYQTLLLLWQSGWAFDQAIVDTIVFVLVNTEPPRNAELKISVGTREYTRSIEGFLSNELEKIDYRNTAQEAAFAKRLCAKFPPLSLMASANAGVKMYERGKGNPPQSTETLEKKPFSTTTARPNGWRDLYRGGDVYRYVLAPASEFVSYGPWLAAPRSSELFSSPKIYMRRTDDRLQAIVDFTDSIAVNSCHVIRLNGALSKAAYCYIIGLLNSKLLQKVFEVMNPQMVGKTFAEIKVIYVLRLPIVSLDLANPAEKKQHDRMVQLVEAMLATQQQLAAAISETDRAYYESKAAGLDRQIDELTCDLYGLTPAERLLMAGT